MIYFIDQYKWLNMVLFSIFFYTNRFRWNFKGFKSSVQKKCKYTKMYLSFLNMHENNIGKYFTYWYQQRHQKSMLKKYLKNLSKSVLFYSANVIFLICFLLFRNQCMFFQSLNTKLFAFLILYLPRVLFLAIVLFNIKC